MTDPAIAPGAPNQRVPAAPKVPASASFPDTPQLEALVAATTATFGDAFFKALVEQLARVFQVRFAFVTETLAPGSTRARMRAVWNDGQLAGPLEYDIAGTPCERVLEPASCFYPDGVTDIFPQSSLLVSMRVRSYLGVPMTTSRGESIGLVAVLDTEPMDDKPALRQVLSLFALRAAAELERLRLEARLQESQRLAERIVETSPLVTYIFDVAQQRNVFANKQALEQLGYSSEDLTALGNDFLPKLLHPDDLQRLPALLRRWEHIEDGEILHTEYRMRDREGNWRWFLSTDTVFHRDANGHPTQLLGTALDITDRKRTQAGVEEESTFRESVIENATEGICVFFLSGDTGDLHFTVWNQRMADITGYSRDEINRLGWLHVMPPSQETRALSWSRFGRVLEGEFLQNEECEIRHVTGGVRRILISMRLLPGNPEHTRMVAVLKDITERRQMEERLLAERAFLDTLVNSLPGLFFILNTEGHLQRWNRHFESVLGWTEANLKSARLASLVAPAHQERLADLARSATQDEHAEAEIHFLAEDGRTHPYLVTLTNLSERDTRHLLGIGIDLEERLKLESQLRQSQKMEAVGLLAGGTAHDLNNILQIVQGHTTLSMDASLQDQERQALQRGVLEAASRAAQLTRQLLTFGRRQPLKVVDTDLRALVENHIAMLKRLIGPHIQIVLHTDPRPCLVRCDPGQVEQVVMNLCLNARDAMPAGGLLRIQLRSVEVGSPQAEAVGLPRPGRFAALEVTDTGCGMDEETRSRIFEPFFTTKPQGKGTGLGLAVVYGIVQQHEGVIQVYSKRNQGSSFTVYLPALAVSASPSPTHQLKHGQTPCDGTGKTLLLAEDEPAVRSLAHKVLQRAGYNVLQACDGEEAIAVFKAHPGKIDLLVMDVAMPRLNGPDAVQQIHAIRPGIPVVFCTGYAGTHLEQGYPMPDNAVILHKPYYPNDLLQQVRAQFIASQALRESAG